MKWGVDLALPRIVLGSFKGRWRRIRFKYKMQLGPVGQTS